MLSSTSLSGDNWILPSQSFGPEGEEGDRSEEAMGDDEEGEKFGETRISETSNSCRGFRTVVNVEFMESGRDRLRFSFRLECERI